MICSNCGTTNEEDSKFCEACGQSISGPEKTIATSQAPNNDSLKGLFSEQEWEYIIRLPYYLAALITFTADEPDEKERDAMVEYIDKPGDGSSSLRREIAGTPAKINFENPDIEGSIEAAVTAARAKLSQDDYRAFTDSLLGDLVKLARISDGGLSFGGNISMLEKSKIKRLAQVFGLTKAETKQLFT